eukprot:CAMPEP_0185461448 /NCGR_PEP_ID=MMETSP1365-20130426/90007_1 /TAXON_ID=38817 /ORGANISM="Gephyrocapsa oceanica, Strain RCC1303" /LENGTH=60 /DNA_ID=CAMNT_0028068107 /DNA_START=169 /DNA_END=348 /DNA_ORIENTATION=+
MPWRVEAVLLKTSGRNLSTSAGSAVALGTKVESSSATGTNTESRSSDTPSEYEERAKAEQ